MKKQKARKRDRFITRADIVGLLFVLPFVFGFCTLYAVPMAESIVYSFHKVTVDTSGMVLTPVGFENYRTALFGDADFFKALLQIGGTVIVKILVIMFLSMFMAFLLSQKFPGRLFFRTALFLPVIFGADIVMTVFQASDSYQEIAKTGNQFVSMSKGMQEFILDIIGSFGSLSGVMAKFTDYAQRLFDLCWEMGIQVVLFIIGIQSIPSYLYEVCELEGSTKWETFWKITFPLLTPSIVLCLVYTVIDNFNSDNKIMDMIAQNRAELLHYACAQSWLYSLIVFVIVLAVYAIVAKRAIYLD